LPGAQRRSLRHDQNPRKSELRINRRRKTKRRVNAAGTQQRHDEIDEPTLRGKQIE